MIDIKVDLTTMVMIQTPDTKQVLVQNRKLKWPGYSFPGGKVEAGESFYDCAVREIQEETGLHIKNLESCGTVHWCNLETDDRYIVFLYKTKDYSGILIESSPEGSHFWCDVDVLLKMPGDKFSNDVLNYCRIFFEKEFNEVFLPWQPNENGRAVTVEYK